MTKAQTMMAKIRPSSSCLGLAALFSACILSSHAEASERDGWYVRGQGGLNFPQSEAISGSGFFRNSDFDPGFLVGAAIGYNFSGLRPEVEYLYREDDIDSLIGGAGVADGDRSIHSVFVNIIYDFYNPAIVPIGIHIGGGIGIASVSLNNVAQGGVPLIDDDDTVFGWQAIAGVSHKLTESLYANIDYRYMRTADATHTLSAGGSIESDVEDHSVLLGLTWHFNQQPAAKPTEPAPRVAEPAPPPPSPEPAPAPREKQTFLVFFDWDQTAIRQDAAEILMEAATVARQGVPTTIELVGHADTSGPSTYNQELSERRAKSVKSFLVGQGVTAEDITTRGKGEDDLLVATLDNTREPRNRRVEILLP